MATLLVFEKSKSEQKDYSGATELFKDKHIVNIERDSPDQWTIYFEEVFDKDAQGETYYIVLTQEQMKAITNAFLKDPGTAAF